MSTKKLERISVVVPKNPFVPRDSASAHHCLCALDVEKLMEWWPGLPHAPNPDLTKVKSIQRSLDWKRVAQIAAYLLQEEIEDCGDQLSQFFTPIYDPRKNEPGREWPPQIKGTVRYARSSFPFFSNILVHVNGASFKPHASSEDGKIAEIGLDSKSPNFSLSVIDGQHRVNGAYFALCIKRKTQNDAKFELPTEIFLDLDPHGDKPVKQAQIFIDVNLYQKKVDRSLVADLFPLTRGDRSMDKKDRAQDIGRKLMLEVGPLVGMIQIPGIRYGVKDVVTLATLNSAIEGAIPSMEACDISNLEGQTMFLAQVLECWLQASGRGENEGAKELDPQNVVYQGRVLVSIIDLVPAVLVHLKQKKLPFVSGKSNKEVIKWLSDCIDRAGLAEDGRFVVKEEFRKMGFLGSGGIARFRNLLWAAASAKITLNKVDSLQIAEKANRARAEVAQFLGGYEY